MYLVTFATAGRARHFSEWEVAADACREMTSRAVWSESRLMAWVLMPDHWHGLVQLGWDETLGGCIGMLKGRSARNLRRAHPRLAPVWAPAYQDRAVRSEEALAAAARYLVWNPVRAGLVARVSEYPYWDAQWLP